MISNELTNTIPGYKYTDNHGPASQIRFSAKIQYPIVKKRRLFSGCNHLLPTPDLG
jgi:hypothetical protein